jgi:hypothetical protein
VRPRASELDFQSIPSVHVLPVTPG